MADEEPLFRPFTKESLAVNKERNNSEEKQEDENARDNEKNKVLYPDDSLEEGQPLPVWIRKSFPKHMTSAFLEDIDPFYRNKNTFVVINKNKNIFRFSATDSLWILSPFNPIRKGTINILIHPLFALFIITTILVNCVFMIIPQTSIVDIAEYVFVGIYTVEAAIKIIARGLILQPFTYFRNAWNWLDFVILVLAYVTIGIDVGSLSALRALRVLRALKTVAIVPGMRLVVEALLESVKNLQNIIILTAFSLFTFAMMGLQIYMGMLTQKCIKIFPEDGSWGNLTNENWERFCHNETNWYKDGEEYQLCGNSSGASQCKPGYVCLQGYGPNPNYGYTNFDTFGWALLSSFRLWTLDFWENLYQLVLKSAGLWHVLFFLAIIFTCSFYLMSLFLTVIAISYAKIHKKIMQQKQTAEEELKKMNNTNRRNETSNVLKSNSIPFIETDQISVEEKDDTVESEPTTKNKLSNCLTKGVDLFCVWNCCGCWVKFQKYVGLFIFDPFTELFVIVCIILNTFFMALDHHDMDREMERVLKNGNYFFTAVYILEAALKIIALSPKHYFKVSWNIFDFIIVVLSLLDLGLEGVQGLSVLRAFRLLRVFRLAKAWPTLNSIISVMGKTMGPLGNLTFVFCIIIFIFSVTGMQLFGKNYAVYVDRFPESELPRWNFTDFLHSFMVVYRVLCGEWIESMWDCMLVADATCVPFFVATASIGKLVISSFFILLLLSDFGLEEMLTQTPEQGKNEITEVSNRISRFIKWIRREKSDGIEGENLKDKIDSKDTRVAADVASVEISTDCPNPTLGRNDEPHQEFSKLKLKIIKLTESKLFEIIVISVILLSSVALTLEDINLIHRPILEEILLNLDRVFTIIFIMELLLRWFALGFKKYFTNAWCCLDFIIVMLSLVVHGMVIAADDDDLAFRSLLALRALRPLRLVAHWGRLRVVAHTLVKTLPSVFSVLLVCLLFWLIFAIMGVQLFAGKFYKCVDNEYTTLNYEVVPDRYTCVMENYTWVNSPMNFDHVGNAYLSLFQVATFKGWIRIMNDAIDSREVNLQPIRETNIYMYLYFLIFINIGSFYTLYLVVSSIINHFKVQKKNVGGYLEMFMTTNQTNTYRTNKILGSLPLKSTPRPKWQPQAVMFDIVTHKKFDLLIMLFIILNMVTMAFDHYQQSESFSIVLDYLNLIFTLIYSIECILKIFALRHHYFLDPWNLFDFAIVIVSILDLTLSDTIAKYFISPIILRTLRVIRLARLSPIMRLVKGKSVRSLQYTLTTSLPVVLNICLLFFVVTFVYAIFGMSFFMHVKNKSALDDVTNFQTFGNSMILLFQMSTFAGWDGVLDGIINEEDCYLSQNERGYPGNCGSATIGIIYLLSYLIISFFVYAHMFIVVILENYSQATEEENIPEEYCDMYHTVWKRFDPNNTEYIRYDQLSDFFDALEPPLQIPKPNTHIIQSMNITTNDNDKISCVDLLNSLKANLHSNKSQNEDLEVGRPD